MAATTATTIAVTITDTMAYVPGPGGKEHQKYSRSLKGTTPRGDSEDTRGGVTREYARGLWGSAPQIIPKEIPS